MIQSATAVVSLLGYNMFPPMYSVSLPAAVVTHMDQIKDGLSQEVDTTRMCVCMTLHRSIRNTVRGPNFEEKTSLQTLDSTLLSVQRGERTFVAMFSVI